MSRLAKELRSFMAARLRSNGEIDGFSSKSSEIVATGGRGLVHEKTVSGLSASTFSAEFRAYGTLPETPGWMINDRPLRYPTMWLRTLMLFVLTAGLAIAIGEYSSDALAQDKKAKFKNKKKKFDLPPPAAALPTATPLAKRTPVVVEPVVPNFMPLPIPSTKDAAAIASLIDAEIAKKLSAAGITPSPRATDEEFLRRAYLDITGVIPSV